MYNIIIQEVSIGVYDEQKKGFSNNEVGFHSNKGKIKNFEKHGDWPFYSMYRSTRPIYTSHIHTE